MKEFQDRSKFNGDFKETQSKSMTYSWNYLYIYVNLSKSKAKEEREKKKEASKFQTSCGRGHVKWLFCPRCFPYWIGVVGGKIGRKNVSVAILWIMEKKGHFGRRKDGVGPGCWAVGSCEIGSLIGACFHFFIWAVGLSWPWGHHVD